MTGYALLYLLFKFSKNRARAVKDTLFSIQTDKLICTVLPYIPVLKRLLYGKLTCDLLLRKRPVHIKIHLAIFTLGKDGRVSVSS